ncbi:hypothetical protein [Hymenobacter latericus]|uniref:hypothetical protein n=1 Tax=Hymenobacter sp. YIM 151858-1 TaxID=2987688 RepID=UPI00222740C4|nr:hypothetical protein [Hymenobacter sp. YIM 151858-1]UYZ60646.1 hypothetical protein OIS50_07560 [Hymenobacter sp. YIM 151858-1]
MKRLLIGLLATAALPAMAQTNPTVLSGQAANDNLAAAGRLGAYGMAVAYDNRYVGMKGTPYTVPRWLPGVVYMRRGVQASDLPMKYDAFGQRLLALRPSKDSIMIDLSQVDRFMLRETGPNGPVEHWYQRLANPPVVIKDAFVEVLYARPEGQYALYKLPRKVFIKNDMNQAYGSGRDYNELQDATELYLKLPDGKLARISKPGSKQLETVLSKSEAERFRSLKLTVRNEDELRKAVAQLDAK